MIAQQINRIYKRIHNFASLDKLRKIIHIDMDAFYASVEQRDDPSLRNKAIAVGGGGKRGVICSASYEARKHGIRSAQPGFKAKKLYPDIIFVKPNFDKYKEVSNQIRSIFSEYTDLIEPLSLDEAYLDVTQNKMNLNAAVLIAEEIRQKIFQKTKCTASAGVSFNKFLAKTASDINKPNGIKEIRQEEAIPFIESLPVKRFYGIGAKTADKMNRMSIYTGADLKKLDKLDMFKFFGKAGMFYYDIVRGIDLREVKPNRKRKSIGVERTFDQNLEKEDAILLKLENIASILWEVLERKNVFGKTLTLKLKFNDFTQITRSKTKKTKLNSYSIIEDLAKQLLYQKLETLKPIRLIGLSVSNLPDESDLINTQLDFGFDDDLYESSIQSA